MTIDPMAAVSAAAGGTVNPATGADAAASVNPTAEGGGATQVQGSDQASKVDLFDYASQQQNKPPALDTLQPESRANYLSSPAELGDQVLEKMESFHRHWQTQGDMLNSGLGTAPAGVGSGDAAPGPAAQNVPSSSAGAASEGNSQLATLQMMFEYGFESTMISTGSSQFSKTISTLMRGQ